MRGPTDPLPRLRAILAVPLCFALLKLVLQALAITNYGWFRDELYYSACSEHLAWGYVDHPPLSIALLWLERALLGDSLIALRVLPALCGAGTIVVTGLIVARFGGGRFAQAIACLCLLLAPVYLVIDHYFSMNSIDTFLWALAMLLAARVLEDARARNWIALGVVIGLGLLNKASMLWFVGGFGLALLFDTRRRLLLSPWPWIAAALALLMLVPHVLWQVRNDWPTLEFMRNATQSKMVHTSFGAFWGQQVLALGPASAPFWILGLFWLLVSRSWRVFGVLFLAVAALLVASGSSRPNYLTVAYAPLFAGAGIALERFTSTRRAWLRPAALAWLALLGLPIVPLGLPLLAPQQLIAYQQALGVRPRAQEHTAEGPLPQHLADMFGWQELAARVARVYATLSPEERAKCGIYCSNYGEAAAIDRFGPALGLPKAICAHNNYWLWGTHGCTGEVLILVGGSADDKHADFASATLVDRTHSDYAMPYENGAPIFLCRGLNMPLAERWPALRAYR